MLFSKIIYMKNFKIQVVTVPVSIVPIQSYVQNVHEHE